jgi:hypothetical protein
MAEMNTTGPGFWSLNIGHIATAMVTVAVAAITYDFLEAKVGDIGGGR